MQMPIVKPLTKAEYEQSEKNRQRTEIRHDVKKIKEIITSDDEVKIKEIHMLIDGKYSAYVPNWGHSMYGYIDKHGFSYELIDKDSMLHNLILMQHSLEGFAMGLEKSTNKSYGSSKNSVNVTVNNSIDNDIDISFDITFEHARQQVESMTSLTDAQTKEILDKISEIENTINGSETKKSKWEKIKPILVWLADKRFDVVMTLLPLLLKIDG